jgi:uncharacterized membrane protein YdjX (TVP38/TMEM64 family)
LILIIIASFALFLIAKTYFPFLSDAEKAREFIRGFGIYAPLLSIAIQVLQVLIAPLPGQFFGIASGYVFGIWLGTLYSVIGTAIGSIIAFYLAKKIGRPFVEKVIDQNTLKKFDYLAKKGGEFALFMIFLLPALPDDAICFIAGLTKIKPWKFLLITILGRLPGFLVLNMVGNGFAVSEQKISIIIFLAAIVVAAAIFIFKKHLERFFYSLSRKKINNKR